MRYLDTRTGRICESFWDPHCSDVAWELANGKLTDWINNDHIRDLLVQTKQESDSKWETHFMDIDQVPMES